MNTLYGAGNRTRTCTLLAVEPKSTESTNSTMPAFLLPGYSIIFKNFCQLASRLFVKYDEKVLDNVPRCK